MLRNGHPEWSVPGTSLFLNEVLSLNAQEFELRIGETFEDGISSMKS